MAHRNLPAIAGGCSRAGLGRAADPADYVNTIAQAGFQALMQYANSHAGLCLWRTSIGQAQSNRARRGRKNDFADAQRLVKRLVANELTLSFVPDPEQRLWRTVMRTKYQLRRNRVQLQNRLEALLEEAHIKLSSLVSDLLGVSARRMLRALADGETEPVALAALANDRLRATQEQLRAFGACQELNPVYRRLLKMALEDLNLIEKQIGQLVAELGALGCGVLLL